MISTCLKTQGHTLTQTAVGMGTPGYSAPEQLWIGARDVTRAADVYSVAMVAVFLFTGREPQEVLTGRDPMHLRLDPSAADELGEKREWIEQALSFAPDHRPPLDALDSQLYGHRRQHLAFRPTANLNVRTATDPKGG